jgi:hypothetical protein
MNLYLVDEFILLVEEKARICKVEEMLSIVR